MQKITPQNALELEEELKGKDSIALSKQLRTYNYQKEDRWRRKIMPAPYSYDFRKKARFRF